MANKDTNWTNLGAGLSESKLENTKVLMSPGTGSYTRTVWVNGETSLSAANLNNIEDGIEQALTPATTESNGAMSAEDKQKLDGLLDLFYPVGSYNETSDANFNPSVAWGGTWVEDSAGRVTVARNTSDTSFDTIGETGGAKTSATGNHTLTASEIPAHTHGSLTVSYSFTMRRQGNDSTSVWGVSHTSVSQSTQSNITSNGVGSGNKHGDTVALSASHTHSSVGGGGSHNHGSVSTVQPYVVVRRWHRTA